MSDKKEKPQIEFIVSLHKIKDAYFKYELDGYKNIESLVNFYQSKENYSDEELITLQVKCESEWKRILEKLCHSIVKKVENNKKREKIYSKELKEAKINIEKVKNNNLKLGEYETLFVGILEPLKQEFDSKWEKDKVEWGRFWTGLVLGFILGILGSIISILLGI